MTGKGGVNQRRLVAIIGILSEMAQALWKPWFEAEGHEVRGSDPKDPKLPSNEEVVKGAGIIILAPRPMELTWPIIRQILPNVETGAVIFIMASVPRPYQTHHQRLIEECENRGIGLYFWHELIGPQSSPRGHDALTGKIVQAIPDPITGKSDWAVGEMLRIHAAQFMGAHETTLEGHNVITRRTQVAPFVLAYLMGGELADFPFRLTETIDVMGVPAQLVIVAMLQQIGAYNPHQGEVNREILREQNLTGQVLQDLQERIQILLELYRSRAPLSRWDEVTAPWIPKLELEESDELYGRFRRLAQIDGDMNGGAVEYIFTSEQDRDDLFIDVLGFYKRWNDANPAERRIKKTTSLALYDLEGFTHIWVGLDRPESDEAREVERQIREALQPLATKPRRQRQLGALDQRFMLSEES